MVLGKFWGNCKELCYNFAETLKIVQKNIRKTFEEISRNFKDMFVKNIRKYYL